MKAAGICGSGIIEAIAELFKAGLVDASGRFVAAAPTDRLCFDASNGSSRPGKAYFVLARPHETSTGREIVVHTDDVRAIQLAKAALYAGAKLLMRNATALATGGPYRAGRRVRLVHRSAARDDPGPDPGL